MPSDRLMAVGESPTHGRDGQQSLQKGSLPVPTAKAAPLHGQGEGHQVALANGRFCDGPGGPADMRDLPPFAVSKLSLKNKVAFLHSAAGYETTGNLC